MKAGPELDNLIAERVIGWRWISWVGVPVRGTPGYPQKCRVRKCLSPRSLANPEWQEPKHEVRDATGDEPLSYSHCSSRPGDVVPSYSTSISAAWEVVEKMPYGIAVHSPDGQMWRCIIGTALCPPPWHGKQEVVIAEADTAPLAICLAALKAARALPNGETQ